MCRHGVLLAVVAVLIALGLPLTVRPNDPELQPQHDVAVAADAPMATGIAPAARREPTAPPAAPVTRTRPTMPLTVFVGDAATSAPVPAATVEVLDAVAFALACNEAGTTADEAEGRRLRAGLVLRGTTDGRGEAHLQVPQTPLIIEARAANRWGRGAPFGPTPRRREEVFLHDDRTLEVQVVDGSGAPRAGVPLVLEGDDRRATTTEGATGIATFLHAGGPDAAFRSSMATFAFPTAPEQSVAIDLELGTTRRQLVLPPTGGLDIIVRDPAGGTPNCAGLAARLVAADGSGRTMRAGTWERIPLDARGEAHVPWLALGLDLEVELQHANMPIAHRTLRGPQVPEECVACEFVSTGDAPVVRGRFVREDGSAWSSCRVNAEPGDEDIMTDADGRFALPVRTERPARGTRSFELTTWDRERGESLVAFLRLEQDVPLAGLDLGDVVLDRGPLLVGGTVHDDARNPLFLAYVRLQSGADVLGRTRPDMSGRFAIHLPRGSAGTPSPELELVVECKDYPPSGPLRVRRGDAQVDVVLRRGGAIAGSLVFADGLPRRASVTVQREDVVTPVECRGGDFRADRLVPGEYTVRVDSPLLADENGVPRPIVVGGVRVVADQICRDQRIQTIRIDTTLHVLHISVVGRDSAPNLHATACVLGGAPDTATGIDDDAVCTVLAGRLPVDVVVASPGCRTQVLRGLVADARVVLEPGIAVRLRANTSTRGTRPDWRLAAVLHEVSPDGSATQANVSWTHFREPRFDDRDELDLRVPEPGTYDCEFFLLGGAQDQSRRKPVAVAPPCRLTVRDEAGPQVFDLAVPAAAIAAALR